MQFYGYSKRGGEEVALDCNPLHPSSTCIRPWFHPPFPNPNQKGNSVPFDKKQGGGGGESSISISISISISHPRTEHMDPPLSCHVWYIVLLSTPLYICSGSLLFCFVFCILHLLPKLKPKPKPIILLTLDTLSHMYTIRPDTSYTD